MLLVGSLISMAQIKKPVAPKPKSTRSTGPTHGTLKVSVDVASYLSVDGVDKGRIDAGETRDFRVRAGEVLVEVVTIHESFREKETFRISAGKQATALFELIDKLDPLKKFKGNCTMLITVDHECYLTINGMDAGLWNKGERNPVPVPSGQNLIEAKTKDGYDSWDKQLNLERGQVMVDVEIGKVRNARIKNEMRNKQAKFDRIMESAGQYMNRREWAEALNELRKAKQIFPEDKYVDGLIKQAQDGQKNDQEEAKAKKEREALEKTVWAEIKNSQVAAEFEVFINEFSGGLFEQQALRRLDELHWEEALKLSTIKSLQDYIDKHPKGSSVEKANDLLDDKRWEKANSYKTIPSYEEYLSYHAYGKHSSEAKEELLYKKIKRSQNFDDVEKFMKTYPNSMYKTEVGRIYQEQLYDLAREYEKKKGIANLKKAKGLYEDYQRLPGLTADEKDWVKKRLRRVNALEYQREVVRKSALSWNMSTKCYFGLQYTYMSKYVGFQLNVRFNDGVARKADSDDDIVVDENNMMYYDYGFGEYYANNGEDYFENYSGYDFAVGTGNSFSRIVQFSGGLNFRIYRPLWIYANVGGGFYFDHSEVRFATISGTNTIDYTSPRYSKVIQSDSRKDYDWDVIFEPGLMVDYKKFFCGAGIIVTGRHQLVPVFNLGVSFF